MTKRGGESPVLCAWKGSLKLSRGSEGEVVASLSLTLARDKKWVDY